MKLLLNSFWLLINDYSPNLKKGFFSMWPWNSIVLSWSQTIKKYVEFSSCSGGKKCQLRKDTEPKKNFSGPTLTKVLEIHPLHIKEHYRADHAVMSVSGRPCPPSLWGYREFSFILLHWCPFCKKMKPATSKVVLARRIIGMAFSGNESGTVELGFSVAGASPALGCYDTGQRQSSYGTLWHKQLSSLQSTRNI